MKRAILLLLLMVAAGCAPQIPVRDPAAVSRIWSTLHPRSSETDRVTARFSLSVDNKDRTGRLVGQLWGYPSALIRLDLSSGTGASVALIRETPAMWTAYLPTENKAYMHPRAQVGLEVFQIPVPFNARQMSSLLTGNLGPVLGQEYASVQGTKEGNVRFTFAGGAVARVESPETMDQLVITGRDGWVLTCEKSYTSPVFPDHLLFEKFTFSSPKDGKAVLRVKSLEPGGDWRSGDLDLTLPQDVEWLRITDKPAYN